MKKWIISVGGVAVALIVGAVGMAAYNDHKEEQFERRYEASLAKGYSESAKLASESTSSSSASATSDSTATSSATSLPSQTAVETRLSEDLDKFIADQKDGIIQTGSKEDIRDAFEDTYVDTYQDELEAKHPGEQNEYIVEGMIDRGLLALNFDGRIAAVK